MNSVMESSESVPYVSVGENHATEEGRVLPPQEVAAANATDTVLRAENEVTRTYHDLSNSEGSLHEKGLAFGKAMIALREEYKRRGKGWLTRLPALGVREAKAYYWIYEVEGKPNNRHRRYWDDREFCKTQNSPVSDADPGDSEPDSESDSEPKSDSEPEQDPEPEPPRGGKARGQSGDTCKIQLVYSVEQKQRLLAAAQKLIGIGGSTNMVEAIYQAVIQKAAELDGPLPDLSAPMSSDQQAEITEVVQ